MVRTKADRVPTKAVGGKAPGAKLGGNAAGRKSGGSGKGKNYAGGNPYHPRETPEWQKPITSFMSSSSTAKTAESDVSSVSSKQDQHQDIGGNAREKDDETD